MSLVSRHALLLSGVRLAQTQRACPPATEDDDQDEGDQEAVEEIEDRFHELARELDPTIPPDCRVHRMTEQAYYRDTANADFRFVVGVALEEKDPAT
jgi:hypothetical protein